MVTNNPQQDQPASDFSSFESESQAEMPLDTPIAEPESQGQ